MQHQRTIGSIVLAVVLTASIANAQGEPPKPAEAPSISDEAKRHFSAGVNLLQDTEGERVEEAYREFKTAYEVSQSPKILGNVGYCAMRLERDGEAIDAYSTYLREVKDIAQPERDQITRDLQTLTVGVVRITLEVDKPGASVQDVRVPVRGEKVTNAYGPVTGKIEIGIRPGHHVFTVRLEGYEPSTWEVEAYAGSRDKHAFAMQAHYVAPPPSAGGGETRSSGPGIAPWLVAGAGAAMIVTGAVTGVVALGKTSDIEKACPNNVCPTKFDLDGERSSARTFVRITDVLIIVGGVLVAGGVTWAILAGGSEKKTVVDPPKAGDARRSRIVDVACGPAGCAGKF